jgi:GMP synthase (glutamine-hydrolysing)
MRIVEFIHDYDHPDLSNLDQWLAAHADWRTRKVRVYQSPEWPRPEEFDLLVLHGGTQHLWECDAPSWLGREVEFVRKTLRRGCPVLGFCLGSQLLAQALGGQVFATAQPEVGWFRIEPRPEAAGHLLFEGLESGFNTFLWHSDHYTLPDGCDSLAYTAAAPHQIFVSHQLPAVGLQFHPEYSVPMIRNFMADLDEVSVCRETGFPTKEAFLHDLESRPETYPLFAQLLENVLRWFWKTRMRHEA